MLEAVKPAAQRVVADGAQGPSAGSPTPASVRALLRSRSIFVLWASLGLLVFNLLQPILSVFTPWLDRPAFGQLSIGWVYAFAQFIVPLMLLHLYASRARSLAASSDGRV